jgi:DNA-binding PadR family transcriptional regulator
MYRTTEDGRALLKAAQEIHAERHGARTFAPGTHLPLEAAGERIGLSPKWLRYYDAVQDLEYEGDIEWDERARYARGDKHYVITRAGLDGGRRASRSKGFPRQQP